MFVDYSGKTVPIVNRVTGEVRPAQLFVAVLGASNHTYAEASWTQTLPDWIGAHVRFSPRPPPARGARQPECGHPEAIVLRAGGQPHLRPDGGALRGRHPAGATAQTAQQGQKPFPAKSGVEAGVRFAQSYILGRLRHLTLFSLAECNIAIREVLTRMNERPMRCLGVSRRHLFEAIERPVVGQLPATDYLYAEWHLARIGPRRSRRNRELLLLGAHALIRQQVDVSVSSPRD